MTMPFKYLRYFIIPCVLFALSCQSQSEAPDPGSLPAADLSAENAPPSRPAADPSAGKAPSPDADRFPPAPDLPPAPDEIRIAVISDINSGYGTIGYSPAVRSAVADIIRRKAHIAVSPGDLVAGQKPGLPYDAMWKAFHYQIGDVFFDNGIDFIMAPGNHDASAYPQHAAERDAYARAFRNRLPRGELLEDSNFPFRYAVILRNILIVALDITRPLSDGDPQLDWLETTLQNARNARATIVLGHLPLTPVNLRQFFDTASSARLLRILQKSPRTVYISGHHHIFYPGHIGELRTIAAPALGAGPRSLFGAPPAGGYVLITIPPDAPLAVTALIAPDFKRTIDIKRLPERIMQTEREDVGIAEFILEKLDNSVTIPAI